MSSPSFQTSAQTSAHVFVTGKVQGVGYRASVTDAAKLLHINGWVRNLRDGRVEAMLEGDRPSVDEMIRWCQHGPPTAIVEAVDIKYQPIQGFQRFEVGRTV
ncbi:MAG: acylphosphatase [Leptolyngbyaceae bacterium]|nr:acylphosphatase [Leptolyngbyaceae bacterium]